MAPNRYYDNAATSFPKPPSVGAALVRYLNEIGGPYGRSAYPRAVEVSRTIEDLRDRLAAVLGTRHSEGVVFTPNATTAINIVLQGLLKGGGRVLISPLEHNAVTRPLAALVAARGVVYELLPHFADGRVDVERINTRLTPDTRLVVVSHQSNVNGVIQPINLIKHVIGDVPLLVDATQSLGNIPVEVDAWRLDYVAFTGHKALLGPTGTGGLFLRNPALVEPLVYGGTGSSSDRFEMPEFLPDKFEAGTGNIAGLFGLLAAIENRPHAQHTFDDFAWLVESVQGLPDYTVYAAEDRTCQGDLFSLNHRTRDCSELAMALLRQSGIEVRVGLHCAPLAHKTLGTFPRGTLRIAPSVYHTRADLEHVYQALVEVARS